MASNLGSSEEKTNGTKLRRLLVDGGTPALREVFESFIHPPSTLQTMLNNNWATLDNLKNENVLNYRQWKKLFPPSGGPPDSKTFDITLLHLLLVEICPKLTKPKTGWHSMPAKKDHSRGAEIVRIKCFRNRLCHDVSTAVPNKEFEDEWKTISLSLVNLGIDRQEINRLKTENIDHDTQQRIEEEVKKWKLDIEPRVQTLEHEVQQLKAGQISSNEQSRKLKHRLPCKVHHKFNRSKKIEEVVAAVQSGYFSIVSLTGGPGFGKTTVANKVAYELAETKYDRRVLYCSLLSQASLEDVATKIFLVCDNSHSQPPENPKLWLLNWSRKQESKKVTLILDNADHVLESGFEQEFVNMLQESRTLSSQNLSFIITSRKTVNTSSCGCEIKEIRLTSLSLEEAETFLRFLTDQAKLQLSQATKIVELCGRIPLALCIVGSLLSKFEEATLIKRLEKKPLEALQMQDGKISVKNVIETSFEFLKPTEQEALIIMSVFPGFFDFDAAEAVITTGMDTDADPFFILPSLTDRSLVEEPKRAKEEPKRYRLHSLIKAFVKNVDPSAAPVLAKGEKAACAHYMSRLADNADYYWGNDTCKQSLDSFKEDRHNFEHFLKVFTQWRGSESDVAMKSCEAFFVNLPQKCMYLEMCVRPRDYTDFLQQLLKANDPKLHPVHKVELLCLLGHEKRKVGEGKEYEDCMKEAEELYLKYKTNFKESPLSEVIYLNSHARLLVEKKIPDKPKEVYDKALKICEQKLPDHPERVATFSLAGTNAKRQKEYKQAEELLNQALALSKKCLGEHVMTAHRFKGIADLLFCSPGKRGFNAVLSKYEESLAVLKHLGREDHKETILTLKNCASCHSSNGNYEEARKFLDRAESIADTELEKDHMWKVRVKTEQALVFDKENKEDKMIEAMKNGLEMCHRLGKTIEDLGNKYEIRKVLNRHPEKFPKDKYPRWKE